MIHTLIVMTILAWGGVASQPGPGSSETREASSAYARALILEQVEGRPREAAMDFKAAVRLMQAAVLDRRFRTARDGEAGRAPVPRLLSTFPNRLASRSVASVPKSASRWDRFKREVLGVGRYEAIARDPEAFRTRSGDRAKPSNVYQQALIREQVSVDLDGARRRWREIVEAGPTGNPVVAGSVSKLELHDN